MQLHGYNLCEDVIFDTNQKGCHFLCPKKGRKTAIHIHISNISNSKQIMMEVVGTGEKQVEQANGVTHDFSDLTADAKVDESKLIQEQYNFCNIHPAITEDLRKRGVILGTIEHRKPDSKYCRKIITLIEEETNEGLFEDGSRIANISRVKRQKKSDVKEKSLMVKN